MKYWIGKSMIVIGIFHTLMGSAVFRGVFLEMLHEGLFNTVHRGQAARFGAVWFVMAGLIVILMGGLVDWIERKRLPLPAFFTWGIVAITALGCLMMPRSGFWLMVIPSAGLVMARRKA